MHNLKPISRDSIPSALERAERYRLLNEPVEAESICLDVLQIEPANQRALSTLLLSLTDQFEEDASGLFEQAVRLLNRFEDDYNRTYYKGVVYERHAKAHLKRGGMGAGYVAYDWINTAMTCYAEAEKIRPSDNDESILRWNTCARLLQRRTDLKPSPHEDAVEHMLE